MSNEASTIANGLERVVEDLLHRIGLGWTVFVRPVAETEHQWSVIFLLNGLLMEEMSVAAPPGATPEALEKEMHRRLRRGKATTESPAAGAAISVSDFRLGGSIPGTCRRVREP